ncbi:MAG TPA: hypothetical protein VJP58_08590 [Candidatus Nitrosocosmicus sp.]|nr:hypothetical protein [Candidatus Nitrosocosmicus sp.]
MAITLSSSASTANPVMEEDELRFRLEKIEECNLLLRRLGGGIHYIKWDGILPLEKYSAKSNMQKKIAIRIESDIEYGKFIYLRKPYITKKIRICGRDSSWIKSWKTEQISELVSKLSFLK